MLFTIAYTAGAGNAAVYFRLRNAGQYWNWTTLAWDAVESANTKLFGTEYASDTTDSDYEVSHAIPSGSFTYEAVLASTGEVIGRDVTTLDNLGNPMQAGTAVQLNATQPNYAPSKAGDKMDLVDVPNATAITAIQSGLALATDLLALAGKFTGITSLANWLRAIARSDAADATAKSELNAGGGSYNETADSLQALYTQGAQTLSRVMNIGGTQRVSTTLADIVQAASGDNWIKVNVYITDATGGLFDPADITNPGGPQVYNGVGAEFFDQAGNKVVMYQDNVGTPLNSVALCHHAAEANQPQILSRTSEGIYYFWINATATGGALPLGQLNIVLGYFNIAQADATYGATYINDTTPTSHMHAPFSVAVTEYQGIAALANQVTGVQNTLNAGVTLSSTYDAAKTAASQTSVNTANAGITSIISTLSTLVANIWSYATRKLTSAWTDETTPRDMAGGYMTGSDAVTITVYETATTTPIPDVFIQVLNSGKTVSLGTVKTDTNGQTKDASGNNLVMLDPVVSGYVLELRKAGVTFSETTLSQADVVAGSKTVYGTVFTPAIPSPGTQSLYGWVDLLDTTGASGDIVTAEVTYQNEEVQGVFLQSYKLDSTITAGAFSLIVPWDAQILVTIPRHGAYFLTVSQDDYRDLADYVKAGEALKVS